jgi:hypothetical protein
MCTDLTPPSTLGVVLGLGAASPTNLASIACAVQFSEPVTGVTAASFALSSTGGGSLSIASLAGAGAGPYTFNLLVSGPGVSSGTLSVAVKSGAAGGVVDAVQHALAGVGNTLSIEFGTNHWDSVALRCVFVSRSFVLR